MSAQYVEALKRAILGGLLTAMATALAFYQQTGYGNEHRVEEAVVTALVTFFTYVIARGGIEGAVDTGRNDRGDVIASDVTP